MTVGNFERRDCSRAQAAVRSPHPQIDRLTRLFGVQVSPRLPGNRSMEMPCTKSSGAQQARFPTAGICSTCIQTVIHVRQADR